MITCRALCNSECPKISGNITRLEEDALFGSILYKGKYKYSRPFVNYEALYYILLVFNTLILDEVL